MKKQKFLSDYIDKYRKQLKEKRAIKKQLKLNKLFTLSEDYIISILENRIKPNFPNIKYELRKANDTNSYYIKFVYENTYVTARISDHESYVGALGIVVNEKTTKNEVTAAINDRVKALIRKSEARKFQKIEREL